MAVAGANQKLKLSEYYAPVVWPPASLPTLWQGWSCASTSSTPLSGSYHSVERAIKPTMPPMFSLHNTNNTSATVVEMSPMVLVSRLTSLALRELPSLACWYYAAVSWGKMTELASTIDLERCSRRTERQIVLSSYKAAAREIILRARKSRKHRIVLMLSRTFTASAFQHLALLIILLPRFWVI